MAKIGFNILFLIILIGVYFLGYFFVGEIKEIRTDRSEFLEDLHLIVFPTPPGPFSRGSTIWYRKSSQKHIDKYTSQILRVVNKGN